MAYKGRKFRFTSTGINALKPEAKAYGCRDTKVTVLILRVNPGDRTHPR